MILKFIKDTTGIYDVLYKKDQEKTYYPWPHEWQGMTEKKRVKQGIFVECHGHGEFDVFRKGIDVDVI